MNEEINRAEGNYGNPLPTQPLPVQPRNMKEFERQSNQELKPYKRKVVNSSYYDLLKYAVIVLALGVVILGYLGVNDKFQDKISIPDCSCPACPDIEIPSCPSNNISCSPTLNCASIPSNLSINLVNGTG